MNQFNIPWGFGFPLRNIDIEKVLVSNKITFGENNNKYFIGYL